MKKILLYFSCFIFVCFILPAICTKTFNVANSETKITDENKQEENQQDQVHTNNEEGINDNSSNQSQNSNNETVENGDYNYREYSKIKLLHTSSGEVEELQLDEYLYGVVSAEMPASYESEALKAQAVVARTYLIYQIQHSGNKHERANICDSFSCCQAWIFKDDRLAKWAENERDANWQKIVQAVDSTKGKIITYEGSPINAFFHSNSGGTTESSVNIWGGIEYPYLKSVETSGEDLYSQYNSEVILTKVELVEKIKQTHADIQIDWNEQNPIQIKEYTDSGRVRTIKIGNLEIAGTEARTIFGLKSTNFTIIYENDKIIFLVKGYGHGVGMSQTGADSLAKQGSSYEDIIKHFYTGVEITNY